MFSIKINVRCHIIHETWWVYGQDQKDVLE